LLFSPGLPNLVREAMPVECLLGEKLAPAQPAGVFSSSPHVAMLKALLAQGVLTLA
jgi:hypothetical protein